MDKVTKNDNHGKNYLWIELLFGRMMLKQDLAIHEIAPNGNEKSNFAPSIIPANQVQ